MQLQRQLFIARLYINKVHFYVCFALYRYYSLFKDYYYLYLFKVSTAL